MKYFQTRSGRIADVLIYFVLGLLCLMIVIPFYNMLLYSFTPYKEAMTSAYTLVPSGFSLENYNVIFKDQRLVNAMWISVFNVVTGTAMSVGITTLGAYGLSRNIPFRKTLFYICLITMYFTAGIIPWYLHMRNIGIANTLLAMTVPSMLSVYNLILMRNYFLSIPVSLEESARIDGASDFTIMVSIFVPLAKPIIATIALFYAVWLWNDWWFPMMLVPDERLMPLPLLLRKLIIERSMTVIQTMSLGGDDYLKTSTRGVQMAAVSVATLPILLVYPFVQRYFTKGIMLGAIKA